MIYEFLAYLYENGLYNLDSNYYKMKYTNIAGLLSESDLALERFNSYLEILRKEKGNNKGGSTIQRYIDYWRIYIAYNDDYIGFYELDEDDNRFCMLKWDGQENEEFDFNDIKKKYEKNYKEIISFNSKYTFNKEFKESRYTLIDMCELLLGVVRKNSIKKSRIIFENNEMLLCQFEINGMKCQLGYDCEEKNFMFFYKSREVIADAIEYAKDWCCFKHRFTKSTSFETLPKVYDFFDNCVKQLT